jgi:hypothetical protein
MVNTLSRLNMSTYDKGKTKDNLYRWGKKTWLSTSGMERRREAKPRSLCLRFLLELCMGMRPACLVHKKRRVCVVVCQTIEEDPTPLLKLLVDGTTPNLIKRS